MPALRQRAALFDEIWHLLGACKVQMHGAPYNSCRLTLLTLGDTSSDISWYTKRATLGAVYSATEVFMITGTWRCSTAPSHTWRARAYTLSPCTQICRPISWTPGRFWTGA